MVLPLKAHQNIVFCLETETLRKELGKIVENIHYRLQKLTLLDYPGKVACTVFSAGCNFRCPFCHNASLVTGNDDGMEVFTRDEILNFLRKRQGVLEGVCFTGGEPLMTDENLITMSEVRSLGYSVKLDTNGSYPERLKTVLEFGLADYVAMDIKNAPAKYGETAGFSNSAVFDAVQESAALLLNRTLPFEFRTTVVEEFHTPEDFDAIGKWLVSLGPADTVKFFLQQFVDSGDTLCGGGLHAVDPDNMNLMLARLQEFFPSAALRGIA